MTTQPRPWHGEAWRLSAEGLPVADIARRLSVNWELVRRLLDPEYRARAVLRTTIGQRQRYQTDASYRAKRLSRLAAEVSSGVTKHKRYRLRHQAKCLAYDTGRSYEDICRAWEINP